MRLPGLQIGFHSTNKALLTARLRNMARWAMSESRIQRRVWIDIVKDGPLIVQESGSASSLSCSLASAALIGLQATIKQACFRLGHLRMIP